MPSSNTFNINTLPLIGGGLVIDFVNTTNGRRPDGNTKYKNENINNFEDLLKWSSRVGLISNDVYFSLERKLIQGQKNTENTQTNNILNDILIFREKIYSLLYKITLDKKIATEDYDFLNICNSKLLSYKTLSYQNNSFSWEFIEPIDLPSFYRYFIGELTFQTIQLIISPGVKKIKICSSLSCDWLFFDTSKNSTRRWCIMSVCGNREKAAKIFRKRKT